MRITIEVDDAEIRRVFAQQAQPVVQSIPPDTKLLTVKDVAERLAISRGKVYELVYSGQIKSLAIGRSRRIAPIALSEFIARPDPESSVPWVTTSRSREGDRVPKEDTPRNLIRRRRPETPIDLSAKSASPQGSGGALTEKELENALASMAEKGWPADVIDQIREDHKSGVVRTTSLSIGETARYLGLSRYAVANLVKSGKLRVFTVAPTYRDEKAQERIPAKDILALR